MVVQSTHCACRTLRNLVFLTVGWPRICFIWRGMLLGRAQFWRGMVFASAVMCSWIIDLIRLQLC